STARSVEGPDGIMTVRSSGTESTLPNPRYKIYQHPQWPGNVWVIAMSTSGPDMYFSNDGGASWSGFYRSGWDGHASLSGGWVEEHGSQVYIHVADRPTSGGEARYERYRFSTQEEFEEGEDRLVRTFSGDFGEEATANVAANGNEVVVFTRISNWTSGRIYAHRSIDNGESFERTEVDDGRIFERIHRIGSTVVDGQITLFVWEGLRDSGSELSEAAQIHLFRWDGEGFAPYGPSIETEAEYALTRFYTMTQDRGGRIHVMWREGAYNVPYIQHVYREPQDTSWSGPYTLGPVHSEDEHNPAVTAVDDGVVVVYQRNEGPSEGRLHYQRWTESAGWSGEQLISDEGESYWHAHGPAVAAEGSGFVPIIWNQKDGSYNSTGPLRYMALEY
ncbi:MAG: hypothetical protein ACOC37_04505, partial [Spirochaetota bacterium]